MPPLDVMTAGRSTLTGPEKEILSPDVVRVPPTLTGPVPFCVKAPSSVIVLAPVPVASPVLVMVKGPLFVVVTVPLEMNEYPTREIPATPLVLRLPTREAIPVEFSRAIDWAVIAWMVILSVWR